LKAIFRRVSWFLESLYAEFIDWAKFLLLGIGGAFIAVFMWQSEGLPGKAIVIISAVFIIGGAIVRTRSKFLDEKIERQRDKIILERMEKYLDKSKKGGGK
jgi:hypothetical protein